MVVECLCLLGLYGRNWDEFELYSQYRITNYLLLVQPTICTSHRYHYHQTGNLTMCCNVAQSVLQTLTSNSGLLYMWLCIYNYNVQPHLCQHANS